MKGINTKKTLLVFLLLFIAIIIIDVLFIKDNSYEGHFIKMDTGISIKGYGSDMDLATRDILKAIDEIDLKMNANNVESSLYKLNFNKKITADADITQLLRVAEEIRRKSEGAFNIAIRPVMELWGFCGVKQQIPEETALKNSLEEVNSTEITINSNEISLNSGKVDLGGIAKGFASDKAKEILEGYENIDYAVLDFGGNIFTYGEKPTGELFKVAVDDGENGYFGVLTVPSCFVVTSGGYERYFEQDGKKYHHILDPHTGYPVENDLVSVTIISDNGTLADALSTACFVVGKEKGMALAEEYKVSAVFLDNEKNVYTVGQLDLEITNPEYNLK